MPFRPKYQNLRTGASAKGDIRQKNKFHNRRVVWDDIQFDSIFELEFYKTLLTLKEAGKIKEVVAHPPLIELLPNQYLADKKTLVFKKLEMEPDFLITLNNDRKIYFDSKAWVTVSDEFLIKCKMLYHLFNDQVIIITKDHLPFINKIINLLELGIYRNCVSQKAFVSYRDKILKNS